MSCGRGRRGGETVVTGAPNAGPLVVYVAGLRAYLADAGYSARYAYDALAILGQLSDWLSAQGLTAGGLTAQGIQAFLAWRRRGVSEEVARKGLAPVLAFLRGTGAVPDPCSAAGAGQFGGGSVG